MTAGAADLVVVGAGTAGLPLAIEASRLGLRTVLVEQADRIGGTLWRSWGQLSAAGTRLQADRGIVDSADEHYEDVMRISKGTADPVLVRKAVELAADSVDWLMSHGFDMDPDAPAILHFHEPYRIARTYWGVRGGLSVLDVLQPMIETALAAGILDLRLRTELVGLSVHGDRVTGVKVRNPDGEVTEIDSAAVVLTTGGFAGNPELFPTLAQGAPLVGPGSPDSRGTGIALAQAIGAAVRGQDLFLPTYGGVLRAGSAHETLPLDDYPVLTPQARQPWEIHVNARGDRYVAEDAESVDDRETALLAQPELTFWVIYDQAVRDRAPALFPTWTAEDLDDAFRSHPSFSQAESVVELARMAGIDAEALAATVEAYNAAVLAGTEDPWGRRHRPSTLDSPPFYAVKNHGTTLKSPAGFAVTEDLRVSRADGGVFENLYAAGEAIGGSALSGKSFVSGMSVTPSISFGRAIAHDLSRTLVN